MDRVAQVAEVLEDKDWVRISIDAGEKKHFKRSIGPGQGSP